jgi:hypothetical protein
MRGEGRRREGRKGKEGRKERKGRKGTLIYNLNEFTENSQKFFKNNR